MRWFWLALYKTSRVLARLFFGLGHKAQWLGWKAYDKSGLGSGGVVRGQVRKPLTAIWKAWNKLVSRGQ
jgi:hypothetical protein